MTNKILIKLILPEFKENFDVFIPVNELVWKIKKMLIKSVSDLTGVSININEEYILFNKDNGRIYQSNEIIINTDIRNSTELILIKKLN